MKKSLGAFASVCLLFACSSTKSREPQAGAALSGQTDPTGPRLLADVPPLVIGHRGIAGRRPEHTLEGYALAIASGADFIEPDLVPTKDGVLIARHENNISETTDVAKKFPGRKTKKTVDGQEIEGYFTEDFTLAEIKTLRAKERLPFRNHSHDGKSQIPTFEEVIALAEAKSRETGRTIGIYPETKHPSYFRSIGLPLEEKLLAILAKHGLTGHDSPVIIQSFEVANLKEMRKHTRVRLILLMDEAKGRPFDFIAAKDARTWGDLTKPEGLREIRQFADGIGPWKGLIIPEGPLHTLGTPTTLVQDAHAAGLFVHPYTFRSDPEFLSPVYLGSPSNEYLRYFKLGVDGLFSDFADDAVKARTKYLEMKN